MFIRLQEEVSLRNSQGGPSCIARSAASVQYFRASSGHFCILSSEFDQFGNRKRHRNLIFHPSWYSHSISHSISHYISHSISHYISHYIPVDIPLYLIIMIYHDVLFYPLVNIHPTMKLYIMIYIKHPIIYNIIILYIYNDIYIYNIYICTYIIKVSFYIIYHWLHRPRPGTSPRRFVHETVPSPGLVRFTCRSFCLVECETWKANWWVTWTSCTWISI